MVLVHVQEFTQTRAFTLDHVVRQEDGERLVSNEVARPPDGVAETEWSRLLDEREVFLRRRDGREQLVFAGVTEPVFKPWIGLEMSPYGRLVLSGHDDELLDACGARFVDRILDHWLVDEGQHLFGYRLGDGQESRAQARHREDCFAYRLHDHSTR